MDAEKRKRYEKIAEELTRLAGGRNNILGIAHCATRLRLVLEDNDKADIHAIEDVDLVKGVFVAGDQLQIIFGAGLVNDVCQVLAESLHMDSMSLGDLKTKANKRMNPLQRAVKALSDVFIEIMPGILAAALLTGLSSVLGNIDFVQNNDTLYGISRLINISSGAIFGFLPLCVAYSTVKRFGGRPIMGIVIGCIMLTNSLADASAAAQGTVEVTTLHIFGLPVDLIGFQGGIIAQGGAVLGYLARNLKDAKAKELCIPSFISVLFGITEPALFGVNLRYRYPLIGGCIGGAIGGAIGGTVVYFTDLAALGFGTTVVPGIALADPAHNGYINYVIAHVVALGAGFLFAFLLGIGFDRKKSGAVSVDKASAGDDKNEAGSRPSENRNVTERQIEDAELPEELDAFADGELIMDFDREKIMAEGYDTSACLIFTEPAEGSHVEREAERNVKAGDRIAVVVK